MITVSIIFSLISCEDNKTVLVSSGSEETEKANKKYGVATEKYEKKSVRISYPVISNLGNIDKEYRINKIIKDTALQAIDYYVHGQDIELNIIYEVKYKDDKYISIAFSGVGDIVNASYPTNHFYTLNIDIDKGERIQLKDVINIDNSLVSKIKEGKYSPIENVDGLNKVYATMNNDSMLTALENADSQINVRQAGDIEYYSYITESAVGISIEVPHALGDHIEYEISKTELGYKLE